MWYNDGDYELLLLMNIGHVLLLDAKRLLLCPTRATYNNKKLSICYAVWVIFRFVELP